MELTEDEMEFVILCTLFAFAFIYFSKASNNEINILKRDIKIYFKIAIIVPTLLSIQACGGGSEGSAVKVVVPDVTQEGIVISIADGLSTNFDTNGELNISSNSVDKDTVLKINIEDNASYPNPETTYSNVYHLTPEDTTLLKNANLSLPLLPEYIEKRKVVISRLVNGIWVENLTSVRTENNVSAIISKLGTYAIKVINEVDVYASIGPACDDTSISQDVRFAHVSDLHSYFGYKEQRYSKIKSIHMDSVKKFPYTIFTNGGDDYEKGTVAEQISKGWATMEATKAMEFDVRIVGNHDYAWGEELLLEHVNDPKALVLASNTHYVGSSVDGFNAVQFGILQVGCIKVGFFGMTSVPWNELDEDLDSDPIPDFLPNFPMNWEWKGVAQGIIDMYSDQVDYMVMVSHLGNGPDTRIAQSVAGIDLVLGGHDHDREKCDVLSNGAVVIQPFYSAQGATLLDLEFDLATKKAKPFNCDTMKEDIEVEYLDAVHQPLVEKIDEIMGRYAPDVNTEIAVSENYPTEADLAQITSKAVKYTHNVDAALLNPEEVYKVWAPGALTQEIIQRTYLVERQPTNTPGYTALYQIEVTGATLKKMAFDQPDWVAMLPIDIINSNVYKVALHKGPALNLSLFFPQMPNQEAILLDETWWILDKYARNRTSQCLHIDTDTKLNACKQDDNVSIWLFDDADDPFDKSMGKSDLSYYDSGSRDWGPRDTEYKTTTELNISDLPDGEGNVMVFSRHTPEEGLKIKHNLASNGDFSDYGLISDYTLVVDIYWPEEDELKKRAFLQTDPKNLNDADIFFEGSNEEKPNGTGIGSGRYCGVMPVDNWYRVGLVFYAAPTGGTFKVFINGELTCEKPSVDVDGRWALQSNFLLFADNKWETRPGYMNSLLFAGRAFTLQEIASMGGPSNKMNFTPTIRSVNEKVKRHYFKAPKIEESDHVH
jgi:2',3'-cyclic-nucleotide 2'-phosphodiesterase (5'-nucleotidase family)